MKYLWMFCIMSVSCFLFYGDWMRLGSSFLQTAAILSAVVFTAGFYTRVSLWSDVPVTTFFSADCLFAGRLFRQDKLRGALLFLTIWSFMVLFAGTVLKSLEYTLVVDLTSSKAFSLAMDLAGVTLFFTVLFYFLRRLVDKKVRSITLMGDIGVLAALTLILITGFMLEGARMAYQPDADGIWSPIGLLVSKVMRFSGQKDALMFQAVLYNIHALLVFASIACVPFSKQFHMFSAQAVTYWSKKYAEKRKRLMHE